MKKWLLSSIAILSSVAIISPLIASCSQPAVEPNQNKPDDNKEPTVDKIEAYDRKEPQEASIIDVDSLFTSDERKNFPTIKKVLVSTIDYKSFLDGTDELLKGLEDEKSPYHYCNIGKKDNEKYWDVYYDSGWRNLNKTNNIWSYSSDGYNKFRFPDFYVTDNDEILKDQDEIYYKSGIYKYWLEDGKIKEGACDEWAKANFSNGLPLYYSYTNYDKMPFAFYTYNEDKNDPTTNLERTKENYQHIIDLANTLFEQNLNNINPNKTITSIQSVQYDFTVKRDIEVKVSDTDTETVTLNGGDFYKDKNKWPEIRKNPAENYKFNPNYIINQHWALKDLMEFVNTYNSKHVDKDKKIVGIDSTIGGFDYKGSEESSDREHLNINQEAINASRIVPYNLKTDEVDTEQFMLDSYDSFEGQIALDNGAVVFYDNMNNDKKFTAKSFEIYNIKMLFAESEVNILEFFPKNVTLPKEIIYTNGTIGSNEISAYVGNATTILNSLPAPLSVTFNSKYKAMFSAKKSFDSFSSTPFYKLKYKDFTDGNKIKEHPTLQEITFENFSNVKYINSKLLFNNITNPEVNEITKDQTTGEYKSKQEIMKALEKKEKIVM